MRMQVSQLIWTPVGHCIGLAFTLSEVGEYHRS